MIKQVKVVVTGYYDVDMDTADEDYLSTDPAEMLRIDTESLKGILKDSEVNDFVGGSAKVKLSWADNG
jgi:hypothetical protein